MTHLKSPAPRVRVFDGQRMTVKTDGLYRVTTCWPNTAQHIHAVGDGLKVCGVDATRYSAKMVKREPGWDGAAIELIRDAVRLRGRPPAFRRYSSVAMAVESRDP